MSQIPNLFSDYAAAIRSISANALLDPRTIAELKMDEINVGNRVIEMIYSPFDHVNERARIVIVGMTPGKQQAVNALRAARAALTRGAPLNRAAEEAKVFASFSGSMRGNLVRLLDAVGVAKFLGLDTTAKLWNGSADLVHFTSALRYPVFIDGENWSGNPDMIRTPQMKRWLEQYTGAELAAMPNAVFVPLGPKVTAALEHLAYIGKIDQSRILAGLPHPSGANNERIAYFLGHKSAHLCSAKTNTAALDTAREALCARVSQLSWSS